VNVRKIYLTKIECYLYINFNWDRNILFLFKKNKINTLYNRDDKMKKILIILSMFIVFVIANNTTEDVIIPNEAIRVRVVANSDSKKDQIMKQVVRNGIEEQITNLLLDVDNIELARQVLKENIEDINKTVERILDKNNYDIDYSVNYGYNHFPKKKYKGVVYEGGYYESIVITLGKGEGDNWWCVLFPPLCLMETDSNNIEEVEYRSFIKDIIDKYF